MRVRPVKAIIIAATITLGVGAVYLYGFVMEREYPYWRVLRKVRTARVQDGTQVGKVLREVLGPAGARVHWHTCSYSSHRHDLAGESHVQFVHPIGSTQVFEFIYSHGANQLRAANPN